MKPGRLGPRGNAKPWHVPRGLRSQPPPLREPGTQRRPVYTRRLSRSGWVAACPEAPQFLLLSTTPSTSVSPRMVPAAGQAKGQVTKGPCTGVPFQTQSDTFPQDTQQRRPQAEHRAQPHAPPPHANPGRVRALASRGLGETLPLRPAHTAGLSGRVQGSAPEASALSAHGHFRARPPGSRLEPTGRVDCVASPVPAAASRE